MGDNAARDLWSPWEGYLSYIRAKQKVRFEEINLKNPIRAFAGTEMIRENGDDYKDLLHLQVFYTSFRFCKSYHNSFYCNLNKKINQKERTLLFQENLRTQHI